MENTKKVLNNIIYLLKLILYFDTKKVVYKSYLVGGNNNQSNKSESQSKKQSIKKKIILKLMKMKQMDKKQLMNI